MTETQSDVGVPSGLIDAVLHLVSTGPVPLGGYSLAEMVAVEAVVDFLDEMPSEEEVGEAVRSLAARQLLVALPETERLQVRGDLGIAEALRRLRERLPDGDPEREPAEPDEVLAAAKRSALVTVTQYSASGSAEIAELSADIVLAESRGGLYVFARDPEDPERLVSQQLDEGEVIELIRSLAAPDVDGGGDTHSTAEPSGRIAKARASVMRRLRRGHPSPASSAHSAATQ
jgi:hypothetical protein